MEGLLATQILHLRPRRVDRRRFLISATATVACAGVLAPVEQVDAAGPEMVLIGAPKRPQSDIQSWNVGLITAYRRELAPAENEARDAELRNEIRRCFGLLCLRGRYIENYRLPCARPMDEHDYLVIGNEDDSGNLKGFLRKYGRKYGQESVIYKGYYRDAHLHALRNLPRLGMNDGDSKSLGRFHPKRLGVLHTLMTRGGACTPSIALKDLQCGPDGVDWLEAAGGSSAFGRRSPFSAEPSAASLSTTPTLMLIAAPIGLVPCDRIEGMLLLRRRILRPMFMSAHDFHQPLGDLSKHFRNRDHGKRPVR
jgi:hypothetical protein